MRTRLFVLVIFSVLLLSILALPSSLPGVRAEDEPADIRVFHAIAGAGEADFYLNDIFAGTLNFAEGADYILVPPGQVTLRAYSPGTSIADSPLFEAIFEAAHGQHLSIAAMGTPNDINFATFETLRAPLTLGQSRLNIIHAVQGGDAVDVTAIGSDESLTTLVNGLAYGQNAVNELPVGTYILNAAGVLSNVALSLHAGTSYTVFITGSADGGLPVGIQVFAAATRFEGVAGYIRSVNAIPDGPDLNLYFNGILVGPNLDFGESTTYIAVAPGTYQAEFYAAGTGPGNGTPLIANTLEVEEGASLTNVAAGSPDAPLPTLYVDKRTSPSAGKSGRLWVCNTTANSIALEIDGALALPDISPYTLSEGVELDPGPHTINILVNGAVHDTLSEFAVSPNTAVNLRTLVVTTGATVVMKARP